jgi:5,10-methylene-tetrahydrofolate dehydrogenase/methenyl tetrahydrofolate cyclohydrolase
LNPKKNSKKGCKDRMTAEIIDGKAIAAALKEELKEKVAQRVAQGKSVPGLATVLIGENPASQVYVRMKKRNCEKIGIRSFSIELPGDITQEEAEQAVRDLNENPEINGILVQLPLPSHLNEEKILDTIRIEKDVDGFHPLNTGRLAQRGRNPLFVPCTPDGCIYLLEKMDIELEGANAVVIGRSNIVGMPLALLLIKKNATLTLCHSRTKDIEEICRKADIVMAATGVPELVKKDWIKPGAVVIDVGMNRVEDDSEKGYRLVGDVAYDEVSEVASAITPVPGGVGPMTIAMLLRNTVRAAEMQDEMK